MLRGERNSPITMIFRRGSGSGSEQIVVTLLRASPGGGVQQGPLSQPQVASKSPTVWSRSASASADSSMAGLKNEFRNLSFLWGEPVNDPVQDNMNEWKLNLLYGSLTCSHPMQIFCLKSHSWHCAIDTNTCSHTFA
jgi:hypothetical protein